MDRKGVSVMISTIVLIAIIFAISTIMIAALMSAGAPEPPFGGALALENFKSGRSEVCLKHIYGETMDAAFDYENGTNGNDNWRNLEIRLNGITLDNNSITKVYSGGQEINSKAGVKFQTGDKVWISITSVKPALEVGDTLTLIYRGGAQPKILAEFKVQG